MRLSVYVWACKVLIWEEEKQVNAIGSASTFYFGSFTVSTSSATLDI